MKLGIALCTYNGGRYLRAQLESFLAQERPPDLLVACDDASSDSTVAELEAFAARAPFPLRIVRNAVNLGYLRNFEQAIRLCDADVIVLSDQDDWWMPDKLRKIEATFLGDAAAGAVFSDAEIVDANLEPLGYGLFDVLRVSESELGSVRAGRALPVLLRRNIVSGATLALRGTWKEHVLPLPGSVVHDEWVALCVAARGGLRLVPERLIRYRQHSSNQIGARRWSIAERLDSLFRSRRTENRRLLAMMQKLRERVGAGSADIEGKISHLEQRVSLPNSRFARLPAVAAEFVSGRYSRHSWGWRTVVRDLVSPM